jgi:hypothetical protein
MCDLPSKIIGLETASGWILRGIEKLLAEILIAYPGMEVMPLRILGVRRRMEWIEAYVAEATSHTDEIGRLNLGGVRTVLIYIPLRRLELWIGKLPQTNDASRLSRNVRQLRDIGTGAIVEP